MPLISFVEKSGIASGKFVALQPHNPTIIPTQSANKVIFFFIIFSLSFLLKRSCIYFVINRETVGCPPGLMTFNGRCRFCRRGGLLLGCGHRHGDGQGCAKNIFFCRNHKGSVPAASSVTVQLNVKGISLLSVPVTLGFSNVTLELAKAPPNNKYAIVSGFVIWSLVFDP